MSENATMI